MLGWKCWQCTWFSWWDHVWFVLFGKVCWSHRDGRIDVKSISVSPLSLCILRVRHFLSHTHSHKFLIIVSVQLDHSKHTPVFPAPPLSCLSLLGMRWYWHTHAHILLSKQPKLFFSEYRSYLYLTASLFSSMEATVLLFKNTLQRFWQIYSIISFWVYGGFIKKAPWQPHVITHTHTLYIYIYIYIYTQGAICEKSRGGGGCFWKLFFISP